jgi:hypothetical protein
MFYSKGGLRQGRDHRHAHDLVRPLVGDPPDLQLAHASGDCYILAGVVRGLTITLVGALSMARRLNLDLVGTLRHWHAGLDADALAFPARMSVSDADGEHALPPLYESPRRAALRATWGRATAQCGCPAG